jgi:alkyl sulfatase BDS1-like metallo-beta-lactamase superfamily hydrolase
MNKDLAPLDVSGMIHHMPIEDFLKLMAVKLNGPKADGQKITMNVTLSDSNQRYAIYIENAVLLYKEGMVVATPDVTLTLNQLLFYGICLGLLSPEQAVASGKLMISGDQTKLNEFLSLLDEFNNFINIVTP